MPAPTCTPENLDEYLTVAKRHNVKALELGANGQLISFELHPNYETHPLEIPDGAPATTDGPSIAGEPADDPLFDAVRQD